MLTCVAALYGLVVPYIVSPSKSALVRLLVPSRTLWAYFAVIVMYFFYTRVLHNAKKECLKLAILGRGPCLLTWNEQEWMELLVAGVLALHAAAVHQYLAGGYDNKAN
jgi:hypothetical protein